MLPFGQKDFGPYISKILASGAEIIFTGNYGVDLSEPNYTGGPDGDQASGSLRHLLPG